MIFIGDDWAEDHHDVHVMDAAGRRLDWRRLPEGLAGIREFHELIATHAEDPGQVVIGIETVVRSRLPGICHQSAGGGQHRFAAVAVAGIARAITGRITMARYRDRHHVSGAKPDCSDAKLLADLVRTDRHNHRSIAGDGAEAEAIKVLAGAHQNLIWARSRHH